MDLTPEELDRRGRPDRRCSSRSEPLDGASARASRSGATGSRPRSSTSAGTRSTTRPKGRSSSRTSRRSSWEVGDGRRRSTRAADGRHQARSRPTRIRGRSCRSTSSGRRSTRRRCSRSAKWVAEHGIDGDGPHRAARDLLLGRPAAGRAGRGRATLRAARRDRPRRRPSHSASLLDRHDPRRSRDRRGRARPTPARG